MNAPVVLFAGDWRRRYLDAIQQAFPGHGDGATREALARALARATTPQEAADALRATAIVLGLKWVQRLEVNAIASSLTSQHMQEAP